MAAVNSWLILKRKWQGLLGKETAVFMPSGTMAQQIALRIHANRSGNKTVAFHPTCHLERHEQYAYRELHQLSGVLVGSPDDLMTLDDLKAVKLPVGTLLIELPQREIGGMLPTWEELTELVAYARGQGMAVHLDGARLWESQPFYGRSYAEICALFDSVYVSFYKTLNGITGAMLLGEASLIDEAKVWQRRHGGNLIPDVSLCFVGQAGAGPTFAADAGVCRQNGRNCGGHLAN